jgi:Cap4 SAVED domain
MMDMARRAALKVYATDAYTGRGEFGELMLHAVIRHEFQTDIAVSKIFFKDRANDTVKGFDCVHISRAEDGLLDLWLGEPKFYTRRSEAIASAAEELREHLERDYLVRSSPSSSTSSIRASPTPKSSDDSSTASGRSIRSSPASTSPCSSPTTPGWSGSIERSAPSSRKR